MGWGRKKSAAPAPTGGGGSVESPRNVKESPRAAPGPSASAQPNAETARASATRKRTEQPAELERLSTPKLLAAAEQELASGYSADDDEVDRLVAEELRSCAEEAPTAPSHFKPVRFDGAETFDLTSGVGVSPPVTEWWSAPPPERAAAGRMPESMGARVMGDRRTSDIDDDDEALMADIDAMASEERSR